MSAPSQAGTVDVGTLARLFALTPRRISQLAVEGVIPKGSHGVYPLAPAITAYVTYLQKQVRGGDTEDLTAQRARLAKEQADHTAMKNAEMRGELLQRSEVTATWAACASAVRARLLALPTKAGPRARAAPTDALAAAEIEAEVLEALDELSGDGLPAGARSRGVGVPLDVPGATEADREPVGGPAPAAQPRKRSRARKVAD